MVKLRRTCWICPVLHISALICIFFLITTNVAAPPPSVLRPPIDKNLHNNISSSSISANDIVDSNSNSSNGIPAVKNTVDSKKSDEKREPLIKYDKINNGDQLIKPMNAAAALPINPEKRPDIVKRPDHLKGVPIERDGHLNKNFRREVLLAVAKEPQQHQLQEKPLPRKKSKKKSVPRLSAERNEKNDAAIDGNSVVEDRRKQKEREKLHHHDGRETSAEMSESEINQFLNDLFRKTDKNRDGKISADELEEYMRENIVRHLDWAKNESMAVFGIIDSDKNGLLTLNEYHYHFLVDNKLMPPEKARDHDESHPDMKPEDQEKMDAEVRQWYGADMNPQDGQLSPEEFLSFRHPEHNKITLDNMVKEIFSQLDKDEDMKLSIEEFAQSPPANDVDDDEWEESERQDIEERRKEFRESIDSNGDGFVSVQELTAYSNPSNPQHAKQEVKELMIAADDNKDNFLSMDEILRHKDIFMGSSMVNPARNMHDEF